MQFTDIKNLRNQTLENAQDSQEFISIAQAKLTNFMIEVMLTPSQGQLKPLDFAPLKQYLSEIEFEPIGSVNELPEAEDMAGLHEHQYQALHVILKNIMQVDVSKFNVEFSDATDDAEETETSISFDPSFTEAFAVPVFLATMKKLLLDTVEKFESYIQSLDFSENLDNLREFIKTAGGYWQSQEERQPLQQRSKLLMQIVKSVKAYCERTLSPKRLGEMLYVALDFAKHHFDGTRDIIPVKKREQSPHEKQDNTYQSYPYGDETHGMTRMKIINDIKRAIAGFLEASKQSDFPLFKTKAQKETAEKAMREERAEVLRVKKLARFDTAIEALREEENFTDEDIATWRRLYDAPGESGGSAQESQIKFSDFPDSLQNKIRRLKQAQKAALKAQSISKDKQDAGGSEGTSEVQAQDELAARMNDAIDTASLAIVFAFQANLKHPMSDVGHEHVAGGPVLWDGRDNPVGTSKYAENQTPEEVDANNCLFWRLNVSLM